jgi:hypothetical protein
MASIPDFVFDTYKTYKYDSTVFLGWLGETAAKCNLFPAAKSTTKLKDPKKKKGNNRTRDQTKYTISLKEYISLAKAIASSTPPIVVPWSILRGLQRIIAKRRKCSSWYAQTVDINGPDEGHLHVINVLEQTLEILAVNVEAPKPKEEVPEESLLEKPNNTFDPLYDLDDVEEDISDIDAKDISALAVTIYERAQSATTLFEGNVT